MSRSWIDRLRPVRRAKKSVGLYLGRQSVAASELVAAGARWRLASSVEIALPMPLFAGAPSADALSGLAEALRPAVADLAKRYVPLHVSLPDPAMRVAILRPQSLPETRRQQLDFARWRLHEDFGIPSAACDCQVLVEGQNPLLLALAMDEHWHKGIRETLSTLGVVPWTLAPLGARLFNLFHDELVADSGALVVLALESWALWIWDAAGCPRHVASGWRETEEAAQRVVDQIQRTILAYVHGPAGAAVSKVYFIGAERAVEEALAARLRGGCVKLDPVSRLAEPAEPLGDLASLGAAGAFAA